MRYESCPNRCEKMSSLFEWCVRAQSKIYHVRWNQCILYEISNQISYYVYNKCIHVARCDDEQRSMYQKCARNFPGRFPSTCYTGVSPAPGRWRVRYRELPSTYIPLVFASDMCVIATYCELRDCSWPCHNLLRDSHTTNKTDYGSLR